MFRACILSGHIITPWDGVDIGPSGEIITDTAMGGLNLFFFFFFFFLNLGTVSEELCLKYMKLLCDLVF